MTIDRSLAAAGLASVLLVVAAFGVRLAGVAGPITPGDLVPGLLSLAALCVLGLTWRRYPSAAWLASIAASLIATLGLAAVTRIARADAPDDVPPLLTVLVCAGAVMTTAIAALYASGASRRLGSWVPVAAGTVLGAVAVACLWVISARDEATLPLLAESPLGNVAIATRGTLAGVLVLTTLGIAGDLRPAVRRTRHRLAVGRRQPREWSERVDYLAHGARILVEEAMPGRGGAQRAAAAERTKLAAALHADVIPAVRTALAAAEGGGSPEALATSLRDVLAGLDDLIEDRHSVVLAELGLIAAIEWLAERTEERSPVRVTIELPERTGLPEGTGLPERTELPGDGRPPPDVEAAAYRIAQLALDNVVRHAPGASASIEIVAAPDEVRLVVADDGTGLPTDVAREALLDGRRGIADMRTVALACRGELFIGRGPLGGLGGAEVRFAWPASSPGADPRAGTRG